VAVFLFFGVGAALLGIAVGMALGTSVKRAAILHVCGVGLIVAVVVLAFVSADADSSSCSECSAYYGRYLSPLVFFFAALNVAGWSAGLAVSASMRGARAVTDEDRFYRLTSGSVAALTFVVLLLIAS
jgi:hypothetical protein